MLFLDIEGTILNTQNRISDNLRQLFNKLIQKDIPIVLNSFRSPGGSLEIRKVTGLQSPCICYGGGLVVGDKAHIVYECGIPVENALNLYRFIKSLPYDISVSFFAYDVWMTHCPSKIREWGLADLVPAPAKKQKKKKSLIDRLLNKASAS